MPRLSLATRSLCLGLTAFGFMRQHTFHKLVRWNVFQWLLANVVHGENDTVAATGKEIVFVSVTLTLVVIDSVGPSLSVCLLVATIFFNDASSA